MPDEGGVTGVHRRRLTYDACGSSPSRLAASSPSGCFSAPTRRATLLLLKDAIDRASSTCGRSWTGRGPRPSPRPCVRRRLRDFRRLFEQGDDWIYGIFTPTGRSSSAAAGCTAASAPRRSRSATGSAQAGCARGSRPRPRRALTRVAFERCGVIRTEIHVDPANAPSLGVAERLGYVREAMLRQRLPPVRPGSGRRDEVVFSLLEEEYAGSPAAAVWVEGLAWRT